MLVATKDLTQHICSGTHWDLQIDTVCTTGEVSHGAPPHRNQMKEKKHNDVKFY